MNGPTAYADDIYAWSREQAAVLRRLAETRRDLPNELDLEHVAAEIEDVGRSEVRAVRSFVELALVHLLKLASVPEADPARHWRGEVDLQNRAVADDLRRSMYELIDIDRVWDAAMKRADAALDGHGDALLPGLPSSCPLGLDELRKPLDIEAAVARIRAAAGQR